MQALSATLPRRSTPILFSCLASVMVMISLLSIYRALKGVSLSYLYWIFVLALLLVSVCRIFCTFTVSPTARWVDDSLGDGGLLLRQFLGNMPVRSRAMLRLSSMQRDFTGDDYDMLRQLDDEADTSFKGATQAEINRLPVQRLAERDAAVASQRNEYCAVCLGPYAAEEEVRSLPCLHRYHADCVDPWLSKNAYCPVCKFECVV